MKLVSLQDIAERSGRLRKSDSTLRNARDAIRRLRIAPVTSVGVGGRLAPLYDEAELPRILGMMEKILSEHRSRGATRAAQSRIANWRKAGVRPYRGKMISVAQPEQPPAQDTPATESTYEIVPPPTDSVDERVRMLEANLASMKTILASVLNAVGRQHESARRTEQMVGALLTEWGVKPAAGANGNGLHEAVEQTFNADSRQ